MAFVLEMGPSFRCAKCPIGDMDILLHAAPFDCLGANFCYWVVPVGGIVATRLCCVLRRVTGDTGTFT